jgi:hypothetical protein
MNRDSVLDLARDYPPYRTRRRQLRDRLLDLKRANDAAAFGRRHYSPGRFEAADGYELWHFFVHGETPGMAWARTRLRELARIPLANLAPARGGEGRQ